ncbi:unnamed protein product [Merluccius merluccius]
MYTVAMSPVLRVAEQEGSMDSLYEAVQSSGGDGASLSVPSSRNSCSRSCSPAVMQGDSTRWTGPGRSISMSVHANGVATEPRPAAKRSQKAGKKTGGKAGKEGSKKGHNSTGSMGSAPQGAPYLDVPYRSYPDKASTLPAQENSTTHHHRHQQQQHHHSHHHPRLSNVAENSPVWADAKHTCRRPLTDYRPYSGDFTASRGRELEGTGARATADDEAGKQDLSRPQVPRSITDIDLTDPNRSTSFGKFEGLKHPPSQSNLDNGTTILTEELEGSDSNKSAGLGKKMKAISMTMRRKMGRKHHKSFSEDMGDDTDKEPDGEAESNIPEKASAKTCNSLESLYSGQSSSSGVTSESNGSKRDSLRLEEDGSYPGQFCGRARVHTDFVPSPYDTDSLKLKVGDIISVISKPPMGIWTGLLNNKVGNFKFIYVDALVDKEEEAPKIRQQKLCRKPRPKTLLELLERLHLQEYASALLLNGYQTVDDLMHLKEKHLIELNVRDPEHRRMLLAAADCCYTEGEEQRGAEEGKPSRGPPEEEDNECLRDSGCFIPSECSDHLKEEGDPQAPSTVES